MSQSPRPNLLYIHSDQHSPYVAGCYGDSLVETPHLDALAERGVVFDNTYCPSPICVPRGCPCSRAAIPATTKSGPTATSSTPASPPSPTPWGPAATARFSSAACTRLAPTNYTATPSGSSAITGPTNPAAKASITATCGHGRAGPRQSAPVRPRPECLPSPRRRRHRRDR